MRGVTRQPEPTPAHRGTFLAGVGPRDTQNGLCLQPLPRGNSTPAAWKPSLSCRHHHWPRGNSCSHVRKVHPTATPQVKCISRGRATGRGPNLEPTAHWWTKSAPAIPPCSARSACTSLHSICATVFAASVKALHQSSSICATRTLSSSLLILAGLLQRQAMPNFST